MAFEHARPPSVAAASSHAEGPKDESAYPPEDQGIFSDFRGPAIANQEPTVADKVVRLKRRSEFLAVAATGRRWVADSFVLQVGPRAHDGLVKPGDVGLGFTATKRIGNAVARNRAKRRLREAARLLASHAHSGHDYVLIARPEVLTCAFQTLLGDLERAFSRAHQVKPRPSLPPRSKARSPKSKNPSQPTG